MTPHLCLPWEDPPSFIMVATLANSSLEGEVVGGSNGTREASPQVFSRSGTQGKGYVTQAFIPIEYFIATCQWFESRTLVGYFLGRIPNDALLHSWVSQV